MKKSDFDNSLGSCLKNFWTDYTGWGRATRSEYWWSVLFYCGLVGTIISFSKFLVILWFLATIIPLTCLTARRLHDTNHSAWHVLWFPEGITGISVILWFFLSLLVSAGVSAKAVVSIYFSLFMPIFYISIIGSLIFMCLPSDKKANKYGKPRI